MYNSQFASVSYRMRLAPLRSGICYRAACLRLKWCISSASTHSTEIIWDAKAPHLVSMNISANGHHGWRMNYGGLKRHQLNEIFKHAMNRLASSFAISCKQFVLMVILADDRALAEHEALEQALQAGLVTDRLLPKP